MNFIRIYEKEKANILNLFALNIKECDILDKYGFILKSYEFKNGRDEDNFIEFIFEKECDLHLSIHFWIHFWIGYEYNDNFLITYFLRKTNSNLKNDILLKESIDFKILEGIDLNEKIGSLFMIIKKQISRLSVGN